MLRTLRSRARRVPVIDVRDQPSHPLVPSFVPVDVVRFVVLHVEMVLARDEGQFLALADRAKLAIGEIRVECLGNPTMPEQQLTTGGAQLRFVGYAHHDEASTGGLAEVLPPSQQCLTRRVFTAGMNRRRAVCHELLVVDASVPTAGVPP